jgi:hypothetical protein
LPLLERSVFERSHVADGVLNIEIPYAEASLHSARLRIKLVGLRARLSLRGLSSRAAALQDGVIHRVLLMTLAYRV